MTAFDQKENKKEDDYIKQLKTEFLSMMVMQKLKLKNEKLKSIQKEKKKK